MKIGERARSVPELAGLDDQVSCVVGDQFQIGPRRDPVPNPRDHTPLPPRGGGNARDLQQPAQVFFASVCGGQIHPEAYPFTGTR